MNAMASGSRRVTVWTGARATTVRGKPDAEGSSIDRAPRHVRERGHAEVQRPGLLGHIRPGGHPVRRARAGRAQFSQVKPFVYTGAQ